MEYLSSLFSLVQGHSVGFNCTFLGIILSLMRLLFVLCITNWIKETKLEREDIFCLVRLLGVQIRSRSTNLIVLSSILPLYHLAGNVRLSSEKVKNMPVSLQPESCFFKTHSILAVTWPKVLGSEERRFFLTRRPLSRQRRPTVIWITGSASSSPGPGVY